MSYAEFKADCRINEFVTHYAGVAIPCYAWGRTLDFLAGSFANQPQRVSCLESKCLVSRVEARQQSFVIQTGPDRIVGTLALDNDIFSTCLAIARHVAALVCAV